MRNFSQEPFLKRTNINIQNKKEQNNIKKIDYIIRSDKPLIFICGVLADKAYDRVMELTTKRASFIITVTPPDNKRALDKQALADTILKYNKNVTTADSVEEAAEMAMLLAGQKQNKCAIVAYGSLSYLGRLKKYVTGGVCVRV